MLADFSRAPVSDPEELELPYSPSIISSKSPEPTRRTENSLLRLRNSRLLAIYTLPDALAFGPPVFGAGTAD
jgi:hypothetical protein